MNFTFTKKERLSSRKLIEALMQRTNPSFLSFPYIFAWRPESMEPDIKVQVLISVSSKKYKRAVDRNRIKRLTREVYRLNKHILFEGLTGKQLLLHIHYMGPEILSFQILQEALLKGFKNIIKESKKV